MALTQRRAVAFGRETSEGSAIATGSLTAYEMAIDPTISFDTSKKRRRLANRNLSEQRPIEGLKSAEMSFEVEMAAHATGGTRPIWADLVEACGFRSGEGTLRAIPVSTITGAFQDGEAITSTSLTAGKVFGSYLNGAPYILVENATGSGGSGETFTGGTSGATAVSTAVMATPSVMLKPYSERTYQITVGSLTGGTFAVGDVITGGTSGGKGLILEAVGSGGGTVKYLPVDGLPALQTGETITDGTASGTTSSGPSNLYIPSLTMVLWDSERIKKMKGARGTFSITAPVGEDARFAFTFTGCEEAVTDGSLPTVTDQVVTTPPVFIGSTAYIGAISDPAMREFTLDVGAAVALRPAPSEASGYISARIGARAVGGTINPEAIAEDALPIYDYAYNGTPFQTGIVIGDQSGRRVMVHCPQVVPDQVNDEDQDGMVHDAISFIAYTNAAYTTADNLETEAIIAVF